MSIFFCHRCNKHQDSDHVDCVDDPDLEFELMCAEHEDEEEDQP